VNSTAPNKALGEDQLPNRVLKLAVDLLVPILMKIFNRSLALQYCLAAFKRSITVVLRKPEPKKSFHHPKLYRLVALMNTLGKILDLVLAQRIQYLAEKYQLLLGTHVGGRKASSCEHGIHLLMEKVHASW
jgi:hypothetical protein